VPKPSPPAIIPVTPLLDTLFVPPPPSTTAQSAKKARTTDEEVRYIYTTATTTTAGPISSFVRNLISKALARAEIYCSFAATLDSQLTRFSIVSPTHARKADRLTRIITTTL
ncbi:hypothetical protein GE21DRAFT_1335045, partial [Neurospora crassa]